MKFLDKKSCHIGKNVKFGKNVVVYQNNHLEDCEIGDDCIIMPNNYISQSKIGKGCKIHASVIEQSLVKNNVSVGPFSRLRPNCEIGDDCKIGNFVEVKNSKIGAKTKICHLAYVGDCEIGVDCNIGCGVIFANYNGKTKNKIKVGNHVFVGSNSNLIAPLSIHDNSYICAGTTVTKDVESDDFVIGRSRQENKPNRANKYF